MVVLASSLSDKLIVVAVSAVLALTVGSLVAYLWDDLRRRREGDLAAVDRFYRTYGEFFAAWKLWDAHKRYGRNDESKDKLASQGEPPSKMTLASPNDVQWRTLEHASAAEAGFEALLVKLASERRLSGQDIMFLGCFREAYQMLREEIRDDQRLRWFASPKKDPDRQLGFEQYLAFKTLAEYVVLKLEDSSSFRLLRRAKRDRAIGALREITRRADYHDNWWTIARHDLGRHVPADDAGTRKSTQIRSQ